MRERPVGRERSHLSDSLLSAAEHCLHGKSHLEVTVREIASNAGTHGGMVNYYFNNKDGLFSTLVDAALVSIERRLKQMEADIEAGVDDPTTTLVRGLVETYIPHSCAISVIFTEIFRQHSAIKDGYSRRGGSRIFDRLERLLQMLVERGTYRKDLDPASTAWMMLCLVIGPHLLEPVGRAMGVGSSPPQMERWIAEVAELLRKHVTADADSLPIHARQ